MSKKQKHTIKSLLSQNPLIPVLNFKSIEEALKASQILVAEGFPLLEITLRHPSALKAIRAVSEAIEGAIVGAGTITSPELLEKAIQAGAVFGVSPGLTKAIAKQAQAHGFPLLPGVATISEAMRAGELGYKILKFFPADIAGGPGFLKAAASVLPDVQFCPTGGVSLDTLGDYLALPNVLAVGGSWLVVRQRDGQRDGQRDEMIDFEALRFRAQAAQEKLKLLAAPKIL